MRLSDNGPHMVSTMEQNAQETAQDFLPLLGMDRVEFYVGNARQSAQYYKSLFGFRIAAYKGPEIGVRDRASWLLVQNKTHDGLPGFWSALYAAAYGCARGEFVCDGIGSYSGSHPPGLYRRKLRRA
jgi:hypothetical protein